MSHSRITPPSGAHIWWHCAASASIASRFQDEPGEDAMRGTAAHWLLEYCLTTQTAPIQHQGKAIRVQEKSNDRTFIVDEDMVTNVSLGYQFIIAVIATPGIWGVEVVVDVSYIDPQLFGKTDLVHLGQDYILTIGDYKNGRIDVDAERNLQLMIYAVGEARRLTGLGHRIDWVRLAIIQPNSIAPTPRVKQWVFSIAELWQFEQELARRVAAVRSNQPNYARGEWCKYCPGLGLCPASIDQAHVLASLMTMDIENSHSTQLGQLLKFADLVENALKKAEQEAFKRVMLGQDVPGYKVVARRKHRQFANPDQARRLAHEIFGLKAFKLDTPSAIEKLGDAGETFAKEYAVTPPGEPVLAPITDKRSPYVTRSAEQIFGKV